MHCFAVVGNCVIHRSKNNKYVISIQLKFTLNPIQLDVIVAHLGTLAKFANPSTDEPFRAKMPRNARQMAFYPIRNFSKPLSFVIPAPAGIQPFVESNNGSDWIPASAGTTRFLDVSIFPTSHPDAAPQTPPLAAAWKRRSPGTHRSPDRAARGIGLHSPHLQQPRSVSGCGSWR